MKQVRKYQHYPVLPKEETGTYRSGITFSQKQASKWQSRGFYLDLLPSNLCSSHYSKFPLILTALQNSVAETYLTESEGLRCGPNSGTCLLYNTE